ncbi:hypothetical protein B296_00055969, partial [Ensete ventricosum]
MSEDEGEEEGTVKEEKEEEEAVKEEEDKGGRGDGAGKTRTARYIPVRQLTGTRTGRYRAVPLRSAIGGRFRPSTVDFRLDGRFKEKSTVGGRLRKKKERRRRGGGEVPRATLAATPLGDRPRCPSAVAARGFFSPHTGIRCLPTWERVRCD